MPVLRRASGLVMKRHKRSSLARSWELVATPACSENPATLFTISTKGLSGLQSGKVCSVNTLRPCRGPMAMRQVMDRSCASRGEIAFLGIAPLFGDAVSMCFVDYNLLVNDSGMEIENEFSPSQGVK